MRDKPDNFQQSDEIWEAFNELADKEGIGEQAEDWEAWYKFFETGYITGYKIGYAKGYAKGFSQACKDIISTIDELNQR